LVVWDRETRPFNRDEGKPEPIFRYYAQQGSAFTEISPSVFPKSIATQNLGFVSRYFVTDRQRDEVQIARDLDPSDIVFRRSMTAKLWFHLGTGKQDYESPHTIDQAFLEDFARKNQPVKLTLANYFEKTKPAVQLRYRLRGHHDNDANACGANQRIEPMTRSVAAFILKSSSVDTLLVTAHPQRWVCREGVGE